MKELRQIIQAYQTACAQKKRTALATVVHIEGSSYRSPGARMLITEEGLLTGAISGGCLEGDALRKALLVMMGGKPLLVTYDTSDEDDSGLGIGLGCNGIIRVLIEPINPQETPVRLLQWITAKRHPAALVTFYTPDDKKNSIQGTCIALTPAGVLTTGGALPLPLHRVMADMQQVLKEKAPAFVHYPPASGEGPVVTAFIHYIAPAPALIVAGAGNDVLPLAQLAELLGWELTLIDGRPGYANTARFPGCQVIVSDPAEALQQTTIDEQTAIVLMSHNYAYDKAILAHAIGSPASYIGLLGPAKKRERMLEELAAAGSTNDRPSRIFGPTGLDIGTETAEEIALSVVAEIKAVFAGKTGGHLHHLSGGIHRRDTAITPSLETCGILILAAGESKRMGTPKQQLQYQGRTLLQHAVHEALDVGAGATVVVLGAEAAMLGRQLEGTRVDRVLNTAYKEGIASSIVSGVRHVSLHHQQVQYLLVMLCDQPYVDAGHLRKLIRRQQATGALVAASYYAGKKGVPAVFHKSVFPELLALKGDIGARQVIEALGEAVTAVPFPGGAVDIDTREAYHDLIDQECP